MRLTLSGFFWMQCCSTDLSRIALKFTDKVPFFADLSVSKTHFTDKPAFSNDLSVNFWPLWWRFTDRRPIFIDMSVNGSDFSKYSAHSVSTPSHQSKLPIRFASGYFHHGRQLSCIRKKAGWFTIWDMVFFSIFIYTNYTSSHLFCKITLLF